MIAELPPDVASHREWLLSLVPKPEIGIWADLGCGSGADALLAADRLAGTACRVVGLDSSAKSIEAATAAAVGNDRVHFRHEKLDGPLPFETASVEVAFSHNLVECLGDRAAFAREIGRIVRPGGWTVMAHWDWDSQLFDAADKALVRRLVHAFSDWKQAWMDFADGWMGRRLWSTFDSAGLFDGHVCTRVLTNTVYASPWYGHARAQDFRSLVKRGLATAHDYEAFVRERNAWQPRVGISMRLPGLPTWVVAGQPSKGLEQSRPPEHASLARRPVVISIGGFGGLSAGR